MVYLCRSSSAFADLVTYWSTKSNAICYPVCPRDVIGIIGMLCTVFTDSRFCEASRSATVHESPGLHEQAQYGVVHVGQSQRW